MLEEEVAKSLGRNKELKAKLNKIEKMVYGHKKS